jgi:hypothetical protein
MGRYQQPLHNFKVTYNMKASSQANGKDAMFIHCILSHAIAALYTSIRRVLTLSYSVPPCGSAAYHGRLAAHLYLYA